MKTEDLVFTICCCVLLLLLGCFACYSVALNIGYEKGHWDSQLYYESEGEFPNELWVQNHIDDHLYYPEQIRKTLKPLVIEP